MRSPTNNYNRITQKQHAANHNYDITMPLDQLDLFHHTVPSERRDRLGLPSRHRTAAKSPSSSPKSPVRSVPHQPPRSPRRSAFCGPRGASRSAQPRRRGYCRWSRGWCSSVSAKSSVTGTWCKWKCRAILAFS